MKEKVFIREFIKGAESLLSVAFIIGVARGVTIVLNEGHVSDSILVLYSPHGTGYSAGILYPVIVILLYCLFYFHTILFRYGCINNANHWSAGYFSKCTGQGNCKFLHVRHVPDVVSGAHRTYIPSLAMVNISLKTWVKFIMPLLMILTITCVAALIIGIYL